MKKLMMIFAVAMVTALSASAQTKKIVFTAEGGDILTAFSMTQSAGNPTGDHLVVCRIVPASQVDISGSKTATVYFKNNFTNQAQVSGQIDIVPSGTAFILHMEEKTFNFLKREGCLPPTVYTDGYEVTKIVLSE